MCGICGILGDGDVPSNDARISGMLASIHHRGPDGEGRLVEPGVALGMRRLAVIDLLGGGQPCFSEDRSVAVVFNGEIYNHRELRIRLEALGHVFATRSDTEVIVHGYEEWGDAVVDRLVGMFPFAVSDGASGRVLVARDRFGKKPLYYAQLGEGLAFASEVKALLRAGVSADLDERGLDAYLTLRYVPAPRTMFRGVSQLPAGHLMVVDGSGAQVRRWWRLEFGPKHEVSLEEAADRTEDLIAQSVSRRLISDVPLGCFLSGGLDSATVLSFMAERSDGPVRTFSIGFDPTWVQDELAAAQGTAKAFGARHTSLRLSAHEFASLLPKAIWHRDEPLSEPSEIPLMALARRAREEVTVVLSGEGGDELFGGYPKYRADPLLAGSLGGPMRLLLGTSRLSKLALWRGLSRRRRLAVCALALKDPGERLPGWFGADRASGLWNGRSRPLRPLVEELDDGLGAADRMMAVDIESYLVDNLLVRGDKMTMAASLEARMPLLDHDLAEFVARLPERHKVGPRSGKRVIREIARRRLPAELLSRPKVGFAVPVASWFGGPLGDLLHEAVGRRESPLAEMVPRELVLRLLAEHRAGHGDFGKELWSLWCLDVWGKIHLRGEDPAEISHSLSKRLDRRP